MKEIPTLPTLLRKNFLAGVFVLIPLVVIFWVARAILQWAWDIYAILPLRAEETSLYFNFIGVITVLAVLAILISFLGWISKLYAGQTLLRYLGELIQRIPILGTIYSSLDQLFRTLGTGSEQQFRGVVYIQYPREGLWAIAFVTSRYTGTALQGEALSNVFVPTVPNPTSGFHLIVREKDMVASHLTVEQAFKIILSLGIAQPDPPVKVPPRG